MEVTMRGDDEISGSLFSYIDLEDRVRADHPLRSTREIANAASAALSGDFAVLYSGMGRPSVPPEKLLWAMLLHAFYSVRSERQLMDRIEFDLLFRGSSASASTIRCGTIRASRRTATGS
jgi:transposase